ncbi:hypothetical protein VNO77_24823 [Canavalia gladiata]|uniref:Uncharacterized protein n=1 Tax=Canavalia gladiata TaxID=3824 RepID=A0AAN9L713_CANGL
MYLAKKKEVEMVEGDRGKSSKIRKHADMVQRVNPWTVAKLHVEKVSPMDIPVSKEPFFYALKLGLGQGAEHLNCEGEEQGMRWYEMIEGDNLLVIMIDRQKRLRKKTLPHMTVWRGVTVWTRQALDLRPKSDHITNNMSRSFSQWVGLLRSKPIILTLIETLLMKIMRRFTGDAPDSAMWEHPITPMALKKCSARSLPSADDLLKATPEAPTVDNDDLEDLHGQLEGINSTVLSIG